MIGQLLTVPEVAATLRVSRAQVYAIKHRIGFVQMGRAIRFRGEALERYIQSLTRSVPESIGTINVRDLASAPRPGSSRSAE